MTIQSGSITDGNEGLRTDKNQRGSVLLCGFFADLAAWRELGSLSSDFTQRRKDAKDRKAEIARYEDETKFILRNSVV
jgi:hypothetical protein